MHGFLVVIVDACHLHLVRRAHLVHAPDELVGLDATLPDSSTPRQLPDALDDAPERALRCLGAKLLDERLALLRALRTDHAGLIRLRIERGK